MTTTIENPVAQLEGYPTDWDGFIGQDKAKLKLRAAAKSAKLRGVALDHVLLASPKPGIGKTSLALLIAMEMNARTEFVSGKISAAEMRMKLLGMNDGDVLIWDEFHNAFAGGKASMEYLLHYMQDGVIVNGLGPEVMPKVTIVSATTDRGRLPEPVLDRFVHKPGIDGYTDAEGQQIALKLAERILPKPLALPGPLNCAGISAAAGNNPRVMKTILVQLRDLALVEPELVGGTDTEYDLETVFEWAGLTPDGLDSACIDYLVAAYVDFRGLPFGLSKMKERLQETAGLAHTERLLIDRGLVAHTSSGRLLSTAGIRRARELAGL